MSIPTWRYKIAEIVVTEPIDSRQLFQVEQKLEELGAQGWEAVTHMAREGVGGHVFILFKRQGAESFNEKAA